MFYQNTWFTSGKVIKLKERITKQKTYAQRISINHVEMNQGCGNVN